ncbi:MAG: monothiol bacilliredoxin BrxC family protein [Thermomicrobiales bacterium]
MWYPLLIILIVWAGLRFGMARFGPGARPASVPASFHRVPDVEAFQALLSPAAEGDPRPVVLFLHDPGCPISGAAFRRLMRMPGDISLVDVEKQRDVTAAIAERTGVRHESPQVIVLHDGKAVWNASHGKITTSAIADALSATGHESDAETPPASAPQP